MGSCEMGTLTVVEIILDTQQKNEMINLVNNNKRQLYVPFPIVNEMHYAVMHNEITKYFTSTSNM